MSSLVEQLNKRRASEGAAGFRAVHVRPSLLFDHKQAATIELAQVHLLALSGLEQLQKVEPRVKTFEQTLFAPASTEINRETQTPEVNKRLDDSIETFLQLLSPYFMLKAAHKVFEYLIRRYSVQDHNVDAVMKCVLPYHQTNTFVRVVQLIKLKGSLWAFFEPTRKTGVAPTRQVLSDRCSADREFLLFLCNMIKDSVTSRTAYKGMFSFWTATLTEAMTQHKLTENMVRDVWPFFVFGLNSNNESFQVAAMMLVSCICWRLSLSPQLVAGAVDAISTKCLDHIRSKGVMTLVLLTQNARLTKPADSDALLTDKAFECILAWHDLPAILNELSSKLYDTNIFLGILLNRLALNATQESYMKHLQTLIGELDLTKQAAKLTLWLMSIYSQLEEDSAATTQAFTHTLALLDKKYPAELDSGVEHTIKAGVPAKWRSLLQNTRHHPISLEDGEAMATSDSEPAPTTLQLCLRQSNVNLKIHAVNSLLKISKGNDALSSLAESTLLEHLASRQYALVSNALKIDRLEELVNANSLFGHLQSLAISAAEPDVVVSSLKTLTKPSFLKKNPGIVSAVVPLLLATLFNKDASLRKETLSLIKSRKLHDIFSVLVTTDVKMGKASSVEEYSALLSAIASGIAANPTAHLSLIQSMISEQQSKVITYLVLNRALAVVKAQADKFALTRILVSQLTQDFSSSTEITQSVTGAGDKVPQGIPPVTLAYLESLLDSSVDILANVFHPFLIWTLENILRVVFPSTLTYDASMNDMLEPIFKTFASFPNLQVFQLHLKLLFALLGSNTANFLELFWTSSQTAPIECVRTLNVLNTYLSACRTEHAATAEQLLSLVPSLLAPLANSSMHVRVAALACFQTLQVALEKKASNKQIQAVVNGKTLQQFLRIVLSQANEIKASQNHVPSLAEHLFGPKAPTDLTEGEVASLHKFLIASALKLPHRFAQIAVLSALKNTSNHVKLELSYGVMKATLQRIKEALVATEKAALAAAEGAATSAATAPAITFHECKLLQMFVAQFQPDTIGLLDQDPKYFSLLLDLLNTRYFASFGPKDGNLETFNFSLQLSALHSITPAFFDKLPLAKQTTLFEQLSEMLMKEPQEVKDIVQSTIKALAVPSQIISNELARCATNTEAPAEQTERTAKRSKAEKKKDKPTAPEETKPWIGRLTVLLEMFQYKVDAVLQGVSYAKSLFALLHNANQPDSPMALDPSGEYIQQLLFQTLISISQAISNGLKLAASKKSPPTPAPAGDDSMDVDSAPAVDETKQQQAQQIRGPIVTLSATELKQLEPFFDVEAIIQSIRVRSNPTLHNSALILLSYVARVFPAKVLANVMPVFSLMGASTHRSDDNYTFHVIQKTLERVVPSLLQYASQVGEKVTPSSLLSVFVGRVENIPPHRRELLFALILKILKPRSYTPLMMCLLLQKHIQVSTGAAATSTTKSADFSIPEFCLSLAHKLPPSEMIAAFVACLDLFNNNQDRLKHSSLANATDIALVDKQVLASQVLSLALKFLGSKQFLASLAALSQADEEKLQKLYLALFHAILIFFAHVSEQKRKLLAKKDKTDVSLLSQLGDTAYECLDRLNEVMSLPNFMDIIGTLLQHPNEAIQQKALVLFNDKLTQHQGLLSVAQVTLCIQMTQKMFSRITTMPAGSQLAAINKQIAALSVEIVARQFGRIEGHREHFLKLAKQVIDYMNEFVQGIEHKAVGADSAKVQSSMLISIATFCNVLGQHLLPLINEFFPAILKTLQASIPTGSQPSSDFQRLLQESSISSLLVIVQTMARFISGPYLVELLTSLLHPALMSHSAKVAAVLEELATNVNARTLVAPMAKAFTAISKFDTPEVLELFFGFLGVAAVKMDVTTTHQQHKAMFKLFLGTFDYRASSKQPSAKIAAVEDSIISAFSKFVLKLNENLFKPLFLVIIDWAQVNASSAFQSAEGYNASRASFLYRLLNTMADTLKSIFVPYYGYLLDHVVAILKNPVGADSDAMDTDDGQVNTADHLLTSVLNSLHKCFLYDNEQWLDKDKFNKVMEPLVDQLERTDIGTPEEYKERVVSSVVPCLAQLAVDINTDTLWKPLNYQVLLKTRHQSPEVREAALLVIDQFYHRIGEEFLVLLPESVQFLAELMEDPSEDVQAQCTRTIKRIEDLLGEEGGVMNLLK